MNCGNAYKIVGSLLHETAREAERREQLDEPTPKFKHLIN